MYIKNIKLTNYRNYENINLEFGKMTTVLIGKNGMGKTNLISALKQSLSFIFSKSKSISQSNFIANTIQGGVKSFETTDANRKFNEDGTQSKEGSFPIEIETTIEIDDNAPLEIVFVKENMSGGMRELYAKESIRFWKHYDSLENLPVLNLNHGWFVYFFTILGIGISLITLLQLPFIIKSFKQSKIKVEQ